MKKLYTISLLVLCIVTTGCSDWLNVAPSNQVNEENLFSTGNGYRNAPVSYTHLFCSNLKRVFYCLINLVAV